jgi:hypothetical protein
MVDDRRLVGLGQAKKPKEHSGLWWSGSLWRGVTAPRKRPHLPGVQAL